jgi:hypothetical protein
MECRSRVAVEIALDGGGDGGDHVVVGHQQISCSASSPTARG